jgi:hypothetical protein
MQAGWMMLSSLHSSLWLSYVVLTGVVICIVGMGLVVALQQSPMLYCQVVLRLRIAEALLGPRLETVLASSPCIEKRGVGLGLPIAKQIVMAHHGEIWVESNPGKGSIFLLRTPVPLPSDLTVHRSRRSK